jgi:hypothetical protein
MIKKYTRRNIIQKASLHDEKFVVYADVNELLVNFVNAAIDAGADENKMMKIVSFGRESDNNTVNSLDS